MRIIFTVILNYNNYNDTKCCIDSLFDIESSNKYKNKIIVVDNCSSDGSGEQIRANYGDRIIYIASNLNCGYAAGNNIGIKYALEHEADYICVLNNDTVANEDFLLPCINYLEQNENVGFVSPTIMNYDDNLVQSTGGDIVFKKGLVTVKNNGDKIDGLPETIESDYLGGACLIFRSSLVKKIGMIPENYFLFFEETEWCWKAKIQGLQNICITTASIKHKGSASIDTINGLHAYLMERNRVVFLKRNSPNRLIYMLAILFLILKYIKKGAFENKEYFNYLLFMRDGIKNIVDSKYPFIYIRN